MKLRDRGLGDEKVNGLGHDDISQDLESIVLTSQLERQQKCVLRRRRANIGFSTVTTEGDKVVFTFVLVALETQRHEGIVEAVSTHIWR